MIESIARWWRNWRRGAQIRKLARQSADPDAGQRQQAAAALGAFRDERSAAALMALLQDTHAAVRETASASLRAHENVALGSLLQGLITPNTEIATASAGLLGDLQNPAAVEPLIVALKYSPRPVQLAAKRALVRLGPPAVEAVRVATEDPQPWVRQQVAEILAQIATNKDARL